jgi:uncharacterized PurR-regulated membrane protein YhhQ (DUF165 family)
MNRIRVVGALLVTVYLAAIIAANWSVTHWGPRAAIYNAFLFIGLDLVARDRLHDAWAGRWLWPRMAALVATGSLLSWWVADAGGKIAVASGIAFACAASLDALVYQTARRMPWFERSNLSNIAGGAADSMVFQSIAFGWSWPIVFGQFTAKVAGGVSWSLLLRARR